MCCCDFLFGITWGVNRDHLGSNDFWGSLGIILDHSGPYGTAVILWDALGCLGIIRDHSGSNGTAGIPWDALGSTGIIWDQLTFWDHWASLGIIWITWDLMVLPAFVSDPLGSLGIIWYRWDFLGSLGINRDHLESNYFLGSLGITWDRSSGLNHLGSNRLLSKEQESRL